MEFRLVGNKSEKFDYNNKDPNYLGRIFFFHLLSERIVFKVLMEYCLITIHTWLNQTEFINLFFSGYKNKNHRIKI